MPALFTRMSTSSGEPRNRSSSAEVSARSTSHTSAVLTLAVAVVPAAAGAASR